MVANIYGVSAALLTPFDVYGEVDVHLMARHAERLLTSGCDGVCVFGTTGEGPSLSNVDRYKILKTLTRSGIRPNQITVGVAQDSAKSAEEQINQAMTFGIDKILLAPPHYYKGVDGLGILDWFRSVLNPFVSVGDKCHLKFILYHIPQVTGVQINSFMVDVLYNEFPSLIYGVKDSSGSWDDAESFLKLQDHIAVLNGDERLLARAMAEGAEGSITGLANILPAEIAKLVSTKQENKCINVLVDTIVSMPVTPAVKALCAHVNDYDRWHLTRAPLSNLELEDRQRLVKAFQTCFGD